MDPWSDENLLIFYVSQIKSGNETNFVNDIRDEAKILACKLGNMRFLKALARFDCYFEDNCFKAAVIHDQLFIVEQVFRWEQRRVYYNRHRRRSCPSIKPLGYSDKIIQFDEELQLRGCKTRLMDRINERTIMEIRDLAACSESQNIVAWANKCLKQRLYCC